MLIGYARVSTDDQNLTLQKDALTRTGCERILEDRQSGAKADRPGLRDALDYARDGDTLTVWRSRRIFVKPADGVRPSGLQRGPFRSAAGPRSDRGSNSRRYPASAASLGLSQR